MSNFSIAAQKKIFLRLKRQTSEKKPNIWLTYADEKSSMPNTPKTPDATPKSVKKSSKRFIKSNVTIHDRTQVEAVFDYYLSRADQNSGRKGAKLRYRVEAFLFFPRQFGLNANTYPKNEFYNDIRPLIRFREPKLGFKRLRGQRQGSDSPLSYLKNYVQDLIEGRFPSDSSLHAISEARLFACCLISTYLRSVDRWRRRLGSWDPSSDPNPIDTTVAYVSRLTILINKMHATLEDFRTMRTMANRVVENSGGALQKELALVDEYCFYRLKDSLAHLLLMFDKLSSLTPPLAETAIFQQRMGEILKKNDNYARKNGFLVVHPEDDKKIREQYIRRRGELKRRMWSILFLDLRSVPIFTFQQQFGAMIAAGLAALWAALAQIMLVREAFIRDQTNELLGISGLIFLLLAVLAYIVKDRIKEIGRSYFRSGLFRKLPDHSERIYYDTPLINRKEVGYLKEVTKFEKVDALPDKVREIRSVFATLEGLDNDSKDGVLRYTKDVIISDNLSILGRYPLKVVHDILRLNIDACLPRLDEATRQLYTIDADLQVLSMDCPKVYHFDIAFSYSQGAEGKEYTDETIDYFRLVIDKSGLVRVEKLS